MHSTQTTGTKQATQTIRSSTLLLWRTLRRSAPSQRCGSPPLPPPPPMPTPPRCRRRRRHHPHSFPIPTPGVQTAAMRRQEHKVVYRSPFFLFSISCHCHCLFVFLFVGGTGPVCKRICFCHFPRGPSHSGAPTGVRVRVKTTDLAAPEKSMYRSCRPLSIISARQCAF